MRIVLSKGYTGKTLTKPAKSTRHFQGHLPRKHTLSQGHSELRPLPAPTVWPLIEDEGESQASVPEKAQFLVGTARRSPAAVSRELETSLNSHTEPALSEGQSDMGKEVYLKKQTQKTV